ncbi:MAG TPA: hypothetical protein VKZ83_01220 [Phototrophicaceae bacterium]|nr:hypothetical protein [Phototrophicaceae bacterium]
MSDSHEGSPAAMLTPAPMNSASSPHRARPASASAASATPSGTSGSSPRARRALWKAV